MLLKKRTSIAVHVIVEKLNLCPSCLVALASYDKKKPAITLCNYFVFKLTHVLYMKIQSCLLMKHL